MDTLVNSENASVIDLSECHFTHQIEAHPIYDIYQELYRCHSSANPLCASLKQSIWPELTGHTLVGPGKITYRSPGLFVIDDKFLSDFSDFENLESSNNSSYTFFHLGSKLSGHAEIVHGGLIATLFDELTCLLGFQNFASKKGVTANLKINYFKPCFIDSHVLVKCTVTKKVGRKCWVKGQMFNLNSNADREITSSNLVETKERLLSECECLVIEPRWVAKLQA